MEETIDFLDDPEFWESEESDDLCDYKWWEDNKCGTENDIFDFDFSWPYN